MDSTSAVVLAGGEGVRLRPLSYSRPKPLLPAATRPILERVFDQLIDVGVSEIVVVVGYKRERVQSHFGPTYRNTRLTYVTQDQQLGSGHALLAARDVVDDSMLVLNGDQIVESEIIRDVVDAHDQFDNVAATLGLLNKSDVSEYGGVLVEDGVVTELVEKPQDDRGYWLNAGVYAFEPAIFDALERLEPTAGERSLIDGINRLQRDGETIRGELSEGLWVDATYPWDLLDVSFSLFESGLLTDQQSAAVSESAIVHETACVRPPVVIAQDCEIGPGAVVGPYTCLGKNATVGSNAVVERSVIDADSRIGPSATVRESVTGVGVTIGAGTTIPGGPGDVRVGNQIFENERLGALVADRVVDQGGSTFVPGSVIGPKTKIEAGSTVRGTLSSETEVRS